VAVRSDESIEISPAAALHYIRSHVGPISAGIEKSTREWTVDIMNVTLDLDTAPPQRKATGNTPTPIHAHAKARLSKARTLRPNLDVSTQAPTII
jgi:hypothetical protein